MYLSFIALNKQNCLEIVKERRGRSFDIPVKPISEGHVGEPGPGDITMLSKAFSS